MELPNFRRLAGIILAMALLLGLAGCSAIKLGYRTLPDVAYWWLDSYADFTQAQAPQVRTELHRLHAWHRRQLPALADLLARLEQMAPGDISPQQACTVVQQVQDHMRLVADAAGPAAAAIARTLNAKQLRHIERKFRSNDERFREQWVDLTPAEQHSKRYEQMLDRLESIYGSLDAPQRAVLREGIAESSYDPQRILLDRERRQQDLLQVLRQLADGRVNADAARMQLHEWLDRSQHAPDPAFRAWQEGLVQEGCRVFSAVHQSTTPAQREHAIRRLRAYQRDLRELAADAR
jgi:hypothetical protein